MKAGAEPETESGPAMEVGVHEKQTCHERPLPLSGLPLSVLFFLAPMQQDLGVPLVLYPVVYQLVLFFLF